MIAQELALLIPERIVSLVLTSTATGEKPVAPLSSSVKMFLPLLWIKDPDALIEHVMKGLFPLAYLDAVDEDEPSRTNRDRIKKEISKRYHTGRRQSATGRVLQTVAAMGHHVSKERLADISRNIPKIVVITGSMDTVIQTQRTLELQEALPGSELVVFEDGGHAIPTQFTKRYNAIIERAVEEGREKIVQSTQASQ